MWERRGRGTCVIFLPVTNSCPVGLIGQAHGVPLISRRTIQASPSVYFIYRLYRICYIIIILRQLLEQLFLTCKKSSSIGQHGKIRTWSLEELTFGLCLFFPVFIYTYWVLKCNQKRACLSFMARDQLFDLRRLSQAIHVCIDHAPHVHVYECNMIIVLYI